MNNPWMATENFEGEVLTYYTNLANHFKRFKNNVFVESGTFLGNGLQCAIDAGFKKCYSIEIHDYLWRAACTRFANQLATEQVELMWGKSEDLLGIVVASLKEPATFWLDAHLSSQYGERLSKNCPIIEEIKFINQSNIKTHTILIDDIECFGRKTHDNITVKQVQEEIQKINKDYKFEFLDAAKPNNIMVAYV